MPSTRLDETSTRYPQEPAARLKKPKTAASSQEMAATTEGQVKSFDELHKAADGLGNLVVDLNDRLKKYKV